MNEDIVIANITVKGDLHLGEFDKYFTLDTGVPTEDFEKYHFSDIEEIRKRIIRLFTFMHGRPVGVTFSNEYQY